MTGHTMRGWMRAGTWLAIGATVAVAGWGLRKLEQQPLPGRARLTIATGTADAPLLRMPAGATRQSPQPLLLDAAMARRAMREGVLQVALPDGTTYPVRMERQETHASGQWSVIGRVQSAHGAQAMVLTFGPDAVFGILPTPEGRSMQIATAPGGRVTMAPAGGLSPDLAPIRGRGPDYRVPPQLPTPAANTRTQAGAQKIAIDPEAASSGNSANASTQTAASIRAAAASVDTTPVEITVLTMYAPELVTLRGSRTAAETEVTNLFAIANQAHVDSGSRVRLAMVGLQEVSLPQTMTNDEVLDRFTNNTIHSTPNFGSMRDQHAADLAAFIRPLPQHETGCGTAWLNGAGYAGTSGLQETHGYVVANVGTCGVYVLAHELGHALGAAHDRYTQTASDGTITHGAFAYSFGHRTESFGTIMADPGDTEWLGRFSGPEAVCNDAPCGVAERIDNVRTFNRMAPAIAAFRNPPKTLWIADAQSPEGRYHAIRLPIRISMPAPPEGLQVTVSHVGGTATPGTDFFSESWGTYYIPGGARQLDVFVRLRDDTEIEGAETILFHVSTAYPGVAVVDADGVAMILDDDPRAMVTGRIVPPNGVTLPGSLTLRYYYADGTESDNAYGSESVFAPNYTYALPVSRGAPLRLEVYDMIPGIYQRRSRLNEVWQDRVLDVTFDKAIAISGRVQVAPGMIRPSMPPSMGVNQYLDGVLQSTLWGRMPHGGDDSYVIYARPGADVEFYVDGTMAPVDGNTLKFETWGTRLQQVRSDVVVDPVRSSIPAMIARVPDRIREAETFHIGFEHFSFSSPTTVQFRYRTVDGTAKAGVDYVAASGTATIGPNDRTLVLPFETLAANAKRARTFDIVIDQISGAVMHAPTLRVTIQDDDTRTGGKQQAVVK